MDHISNQKRIKNFVVEKRLIPPHPDRANVRLRVGPIQQVNHIEFICESQVIGMFIE